MRSTADRDRPSTRSPPSAPSTTAALAEQNRIFKEATRSRNAGDDERAARLFAELLRRYPTSPLASEARAERFRALGRLGRKKEAAQEARRYLGEHAEGPAREEARDLALPPAPSP